MLLLSTIFRRICRTTHERLAVDALRHLRGADAERWCDLLLHHHSEFLAGCRAPDDRFKDFRNHVILVRRGSSDPADAADSGRALVQASSLVPEEGARASGDACSTMQGPVRQAGPTGSYWGGAPQESRRWYGRLIDALRRREWGEAAFAAGCLSHYFSDPFMPLNTASTEEATKIHRALEFCISRSYGRLQHIIEHDGCSDLLPFAPRKADLSRSERRLTGYPQVETPRSNDWLEKMILTGAELAHTHYDAILQHFDMQRAARDPLSSMDQKCQDRIAECLAHAVVGFARVLERAISEAEVEPPLIETTLQGFLITIISPLRAISGHIADLNERMALEAALDEAQRTGKVIKNLTEEHREIRRFHAEEILHVSLHHLDQQPASPTGALHGTGQPERFHPNHLLTHAVIPNDAPSSTAWREAQRRVRGAAFQPGTKKLAA